MMKRPHYRHRRSGRTISVARVVAVHEAGHMLAALQADFGVHAAAIDPEEGRGWTEIDGVDWLEDEVALRRAARACGARIVRRRMRPLTDRQRREVGAYVRVCLAGVVAESLLVQGRAPRYLSARDDDRLDAETAARLLAPHRARALVAEERVRVRGQLLRQWGELLVVARELRKRRALHASDLSRIFRRMFPERRGPRGRR